MNGKRDFQNLLQAAVIEVLLMLCSLHCSVSCNVVWSLSNIPGGMWCHSKNQLID